MQGFRQKRLPRAEDGRGERVTTPERWKAEEYNADYKNAIGVISQFFPILLDKIPLKTNDFVLEIGLGSGKWSAAFSIIGCRVVGVDNNEKILDHVIENFPQLTKAMALVKDDAATLKRIPNQVFSLVFSEGLLEHFLDDTQRQNVIINMFMKLKPNGKCLCIVPAQNHADDEIYYENPEQLIAEFEKIQGFASVEGFEMKSQDNKMRFFFVIATKGPE